MNIDELTEKYNKKYFNDSEALRLKEIMSVNHDPHPFMIGSEHIVHADKHNNGILSKEVMEEVGCAHPGCNLSYDEHTFNTVLFIQLKRDVTNIEITNELRKMADDMLEDKIDGFVMVETEEKFRIIDTEESHETTSDK